MRLPRRPRHQPAPSICCQTPNRSGSRAGSRARIEVPDLCVHQLFEQQVERTPDAIALIFQDQELTYSQLNARANQLAHHLIDLGVGPEVIVAVCLERSVELIVALLAILKAGGAYLPLDPSWPDTRLHSPVAASGACLVLTDCLFGRLLLCDFN